MMQCTMLLMNSNDLIAQFNKSNLAKQFTIAYGGDGELLKIAAEVGNKKGIIPIRNYSQCPEHRSFLEELCTRDIKTRCLKSGLKYYKAPYVVAEVDCNEHTYKGISEVVVKSHDPTEALRFSVIVNGKTYMKQCIADGFIFASKLGSHGYFKSVTRTLFTDDHSVGLGFIAPTYGICNLVLKATDDIIVKFERGTTTSIAYDKKFETTSLPSGSEVKLYQASEGVALYGYDIFCCPECRRLRNSTLVNDQYLG